MNARMIRRCGKPGAYWFIVEGKGHSWGSFPSRSAALAYIEQVAAEDQEYREWWAEQRNKIAARFRDGSQ